MKRTKRQSKALAALNLDLFERESVYTPAPATLYTRIKEAAGAVSSAVATVPPPERSSGTVTLPSVEELYRLFDHYNWMYFNGQLPRTRIEYSTRMTSAGAYIPADKLIRMGRKYHEIFPEDLHDTLKHEMIHIIHFNHNAAFRAEAKRIGASVNARSHPSLRKPPRYIYLCRNCHTEYPRQKLFRLASCGICSEGGRYDGRYKLVLIDSPALRKRKRLID